MSELIKVDSHVHIFKTSAEGAALKVGYEIWEYGKQDHVEFSAYGGSFDDFQQAMDESGFSWAIWLIFFLAHEERKRFRDRLPEGLGEAERRRAEADFEAELAELMMAQNIESCAIARQDPRVLPFVAVDVTVLPGETGVAHLRDLAENHGARGVKLHGPMQRFSMGDERLMPVYAACQELGLPVIGHSGPDLEGKGYGEPRAFGAALEAFPDLNIVLAHLGGAAWQQAKEVADAYPNAYFDCCEIIEWTRSERGPTDQQLGQLIKDIGPDRVILGSDFPWYDLDRTVDRVMSLPVLSDEEKQGIIGANAMRVLGIA